MLKELITNPWTRYWLYDENPKGTFLYIIKSFVASVSFYKLETLNWIAAKHPDVLNELTDSEMYHAFLELVGGLEKRRARLDFRELEWVYKYIKSLNVRTDIERHLYLKLLVGDNGWDEHRKSFRWHLSAREMKSLAVCAVYTCGLGEKRKMELTQEFDLPSDEYARSYFRTLINDGHWEKALKLKLNNIDEEVIKALVKMVEAGHVRLAQETAEHLLPGRNDIMEELDGFGKLRAADYHIR